MASTNLDSDQVENMKLEGEIGQLKTVFEQSEEKTSPTKSESLHAEDRKISGKSKESLEDAGGTYVYIFR